MPPAQGAVPRVHKATLRRKLLALALLAGPLLPAQKASSQEIRARIRLTINGTPVPAIFHENAATRELRQLLPLTLIFQDYASAEKIAYLPRKLATAGAPAGFTPAAGDIAYYAPWGNLAIFYRSQPGANGLVSPRTHRRGIRRAEHQGAAASHDRPRAVAASIHALGR